MKDNTMPTISLLRNIDIGRYPWCNSAVMFHVENGKGTFKHIITDLDDDYWYKNPLMLNGHPLVQANTPFCSTCCAWLATGYGIENISCSELGEVRNRINTDYVDINTSFELMKPLLGLLQDGFYILADIPHYPTNGDNIFFYDIPNEPTKINAACESFYNHDFFDTVEGFPKYLYPTQSDDYLNDERVDYYMDVLRSTSNPPRAIPYHQYGFISALIDGHHKATAAARLRMPINCLTIIPNTMFSTWKDMNGNERKQAWFSGICFSPEEIEKYSYNKTDPYPNVSIKAYNLLKGKVSVPIKADTYPTVEELTNIYAVQLENADITDEMLNEWMEPHDSEKICKLRYALVHFIYNNRPRAIELAKKIIAANHSALPVKEAYRALLHDKSEQTEKMFVDYLIDHSSDDECWEIVNSYWSE